MKKVTCLIKKYALWTLLLAPAGLILRKTVLFSNYTVSALEIFIWFAVCLLLMFFIAADNRARIARGKQLKNIGMADAVFGKVDEFSYDTGRKTASYPPVSDSQMLFDKPRNFVFGRDNDGNYICMPNDELRNVLITGGSGSGKSSAGIINYLLLNKDRINTLYLDPKGELTDITYQDGDNTVIFKPSDDQCTVGYDPFWELSTFADEQTVYKTMQMVAISLIPHVGGENAIWYDSARELFTGLLVYGYIYKQMRTLPQIVRYSIGNPIREIIKEICDTAPSDSIVYRQVINFRDLNDEVLASIMMNLTAAVRIFGTDETLVKALTQDTSWNPSTLLYKNVAVCLDINELSRWGQLIYLVVNQFVSYMFGLPEHREDPTRKPICLCLDETVAIMQSVGGRLEQLPQALRFIRSKGAMCIISVQSIDGLKCVLSEAEVADMLSNLQYKLFLDATTLETQKTVSEWGGTFLEKSVSWSGTGAKRTQQTSYSESHIVRPQDVMTLPRYDEAILISPKSGYNRLKKVSYYKDPQIQKIINSTERV